MSNEQRQSVNEFDSKILEERESSQDDLHKLEEEENLLV